MTKKVGRKGGKKLCTQSRQGGNDHPAMGDRGKLTALQPHEWIGSS
jgi:hypothetical protein